VKCKNTTRYQTAMDSFALTLTGHITSEDKQRSDYFYVPLDLPSPADRLHIRYDFSGTVAASQPPTGNVIDIGLFDPLGADFPGAAGFRGWSGSARHEFRITPTDATPGYLPGPLPPGRYQIILGLYHVQPAGADYTIDVEADLAAAETTTTIAIYNPHTSPAPIDTQPTLWLRGDLHSHTEHSDAKGTLDQLVAKARALGLDFLAITDHNTVSHHAHLSALASDDLLLIPGQEVTTYHGHMNVWGTSRWCDFRCRTSDDVAQVIDLAHANGGLCSINHPKTAGPPWQYDLDLSVDTLEVWHGPWPARNTDILTLWDQLLNSGRRIPGVGGSDYHCPAGEEMGFLRLGWPTTWVKTTERSTGAVLDAIKRGHTSISAAPDGPRIDLRATAGAVRAEMGSSLVQEPGSMINVDVQVERGAGWTLHLVADGATVAEAPITAALALLHFDVAAQRYLRAEVVGDAPRELLPPSAPSGLDLRNWRWALSNPIYIETLQHV
jgi:hypothetical protein